MCVYLTVKKYFSISFGRICVLKLHRKKKSALHFCTETDLTRTSEYLNWESSKELTDGASVPHCLVGEASSPSRGPSCPHKIL